MAFSINNTTSNITLNTTVPYLVVDDEGLKAFAVNVGPPGAVGPAGADGSDAEATTDAGDLTTGTLPLGRLSGITTSQLSATASILGSQLSATAGIVSAQITSLDAAKLTGRVAASLINGGTSSQFLRGDGTFSNTLAGALNLGGDLIGTAAAATGTFLHSDSVSGTDNKLVGLHAANSFTTSRTGYILVRGINHASNGGGVEIRPCTAGGQTRLLFANGNTALSVDSAMVMGAFTGSTATFSGAVGTGALTVTGAMAASGAVSGTTGAFSGTVTLSTACKIIYGSAGTTAAANNEIAGAVGGLRYNVASGLAHTLLVANTAALTLNSTSATFSGTLSATSGTFSSNVNMTGGVANLIMGASGISDTWGFILNARNDGRIRIGGGTSESAGTGAQIELKGVSAAANPGRLLLACGIATGASIVFLDRTSATALTVADTGTTVAKIILAANTPATATSTGTAGQIAWDTFGNIYICSATNTWRRVATSTF